MPIYEYQCDDCGSRFEKLVRRAAEVNEIQCPSCGQQRLSQQFSSFATHSNGGSKDAEAPVCPSGMCNNPGMCRMNN